MSTTSARTFAGRIEDKPWVENKLTISNANSSIWAMHGFFMLCHANRQSHGIHGFEYRFTASRGLHIGCGSLLSIYLIIAIA
jgi:hypothetical protein